VTGLTNFCCERLDLPVPRLEEYVGRRDIKLFDQAMRPAPELPEGD